MAEKKGLLRRIFSFGSAPEDERTPENGETPRPNDLEIGREDAPDPDARPVAAASVVADAEAGAAPRRFPRWADLARTPLARPRRPRSLRMRVPRAPRLKKKP